MAQVTIHERPGRLRRPILLLAFAGWNDAAESATNAVIRARSESGTTRLARVSESIRARTCLSESTVARACWSMSMRTGWHVRRIGMD